jgi:SAM-dependent methyltransferase
MTHGNSVWQTPELAATYLQGVRGAIPGAQLQFAIITQILSLWCPQPRRILDLGCGDGILGRFLLRQFPSTPGVFIDFSEPMLEATRRQVGDAAGATIVKADFSSSAWLDSLNDHGPIDVVVSGFAIHHQPDARKKTLYREIYELLASPGVFLNLEHVASATPEVEKLFDDFFVDHLYRFHSQRDPATSRKEIAHTYYHRPDKQENILASVYEQGDWLRQLGFRDVDCFFKLFERAVFGGRKINPEAHQD